jgi:Gpi18-like mannosyltransferase
VPRRFARLPIGVWLGLLVLAAFVIRVPLVLYDAGHGDIRTFAAWATWVNQGGLVEAYGRSVNYPPLYLYLLGITGRIGEALGLGGTFLMGNLSNAIVKVPALVADLLLGPAVYWAARQWMGPARSLVSAALVMLSPALMYDTAFWGQVDSIHSLFMVGAIGWALAGRSALAGVALALALTMKAQSLVAIPIVAALVLRQGRAAVVQAALGGLAALAVALTPAALQSALPQTAAVYLGVTETFPATTLNAYNLWYLASGIWPELPIGGPDDVQLLPGITFRSLGLLLFGGWVLLTLGLVWARGRSWMAWVAAGSVALAFFLLPTQIHERYMFPALVFLAIVAPLDPRVALAWGVLTVTFWLNLALVLPPPMPWAGVLAGMSVPQAQKIAAVNLLVLAFLVGFQVLRTWPRAAALPSVSFAAVRRTAVVAGAAAVLFALAAVLGRAGVWESPVSARSLDAKAQSVDAASWPGVRLAGFRMQPECPVPGNIVRLSLYWQPTQPEGSAAPITVLLTSEGRGSTLLSDRNIDASFYPARPWRVDRITRTDHEFWLADNLPRIQHQIEVGPLGRDSVVPLVRLGWDRLPDGSSC